MALRSLAEKVGARLVRWATRNSPPPPPAAASELDMALKFEGSIEEHILAINKSIIEEARIDQLESKKRIRKSYRDIGIMSAACVGLLTFYWSCAEDVFAKRSKQEGNAADAKGEGSAADAKGEGCAADAKGEGNAADAKGEGNVADAKE